MLKSPADEVLVGDRFVGSRLHVDILDEQGLRVNVKLTHDAPSQCNYCAAAKIKVSRLQKKPGVGGRREFSSFGGRYVCSGILDRALRNLVDKSAGSEYVWWRRPPLSRGFLCILACSGGLGAFFALIPAR
jgi:hypothetical protein